MKTYHIINTLTAIMCICALSAASCTQETPIDAGPDRQTEERLDSLRQIFRTTPSSRLPAPSFRAHWTDMTP